MVRQIVLALIYLMSPTACVLAQDIIYPVGSNSPTSSLSAVHVEKDRKYADHYAFVAGKDSQYKLRLGYPTEDEAGFLPNNGAPIIVLWLTVENLSRSPMSFDPSKFTATDDQGHTYAQLSANEAFDRIINAPGGAKAMAARNLRGLTLGKAGKAGEDQARDETMRFVLESGEVPAQGLKEGLIFFEAPEKKKFTLNISLGDLWSKSFPFTTVKPKK